MNLRKLFKNRHVSFNCPEHGYELDSSINTWINLLPPQENYQHDLIRYGQSLGIAALMVRCEVTKEPVIANVPGELQFKQLLDAEVPVHDLTTVAPSNADLGPMTDSQFTDWVEMQMQNIDRLLGETK